MARRRIANKPPQDTRFINRELSWLEFNDRVLREAQCPDVPLLERLKFLAIVSSNLDEFFMIRVAGLKQQRAAGVRRKDASGLTPTGQLVCISHRVKTMVADLAEVFQKVVQALAGEDIHLLEAEQWSPAQKRFLEDYFHQEVFPTLTPLGMNQLDPQPLLPGLRLHVILRLQKEGQEESIAIVPVPTALPRFVTIPARSGLHLARLEDVVQRHAHRLFPDHDVLASAVFRVTRDADVAIDDDEAADLLQNVEQAIRERSRRNVVRLEISARTDPTIRQYLMDLFDVSAAEVFETVGMLDAGALMDVTTRPGQEQLKYEDWPAQPPMDLLDSEDLFQSLQEHDVLLMRPYESFEPVIELVQHAARDPQVLAIKQTLYRTTGDSPIVRALMDAASEGKQVTVLVELKARFDEQRNVGWARRMEEAGCDVIYGVAGLKTHAKILLIVRREEYGIRRYLHMSTGNYNDRTARLYSDIDLMSSDRELATDASAFFNLLTGYSQQVGWSKLAIAPTGLRQRFLELIDREIQSSTPDQPGLIMAKVNSLQDPDIIEALYRASQAGVTVRLNVRGICCLRPGVEELSENIEVTSIIDRFLEHARVYYFRNGGHEEVYLSSADWMVRNLDKRLETFFPVTADPQRRRLIAILRTFMDDSVKARRLLSDGSYVAVKTTDSPIRSQEYFYRQALEATQAARQTTLQFRPLSKKTSAEDS